MDVVPKRLWTASALLSIIVASLIFIFNGNLDGAAAWANIMALPVAIVGVVLTLRVSGDRTSGAKSHDRDAAVHRATSGGGVQGISQMGYAAKGDQINVAGDYIRRGGAGRVKGE